MKFSTFKLAAVQSLIGTIDIESVLDTLTQTLYMFGYYSMSRPLASAGTTVVADA